MEVVDTTRRLELVRDTLSVTDMPMMYDADTGGPHPDHFYFTVKALEMAGVSAAVIEDKGGVKHNSLLDNKHGRGRHLHQLCPIQDFCEKIRAGNRAKRNPDFMIVARMEALIANRSMEEALDRAHASVEAGADGVMIHSRHTSPAQVLDFLDRFCRGGGGVHPDIPVVVVPSSYDTIVESELADAGASICIYANHLFRAAYPAMLRTAESILSHSRSHEASRDYCMSIKSITTLIQQCTTGEATHSCKEEEESVETPHPKASRWLANSQRAAFSTNSILLQPELSTINIDHNDGFLANPSPKSSSSVDPTQLLDFMKNSLNVSFYTGVPDSCLKHFCSHLEENDDESSPSTHHHHVVAANEGAAVGLAVGHYLATRQIPLVYLQNSGLGNAVNPIMSMAHEKVYGIPMILLMGWRGAPGHAHDEPQHVVMGRQTRDILESIQVETFVLPLDTNGAKATMQAAHEAAKLGSCPVAVLAAPNTFGSSSSGSGGMMRSRADSAVLHLTREEAISSVLKKMRPSDAVVSTTGFTSREVYELREAAKQSHSSDFLCVGSMGHAISIAQGIALAQPDRTVWCLDGDGAALMHAGSMTLSASMGLSNLRHVLFNNEVHESVGGQPTVASQKASGGKGGPLWTFAALAQTLGYKCIGRATSAMELTAKLQELARQEGLSDGPRFLEIKVGLGTRSDLGRPKHTTEDAKNAFMHFLEQPVERLPTFDINTESSSKLESANDALLLTPGPLTTSRSVKEAMLRDLGSRDKSFIALTARVREKILNVLEGDKKGLTSVLLQGSGTFAVEAMLAQFVPKETGKVLILCNGAYGRRMASICDVLKRQYVLVESPEDEPLNLEKVIQALDSVQNVTHVGVASCETTTGVLNPVSDIAELVSSRRKRLLIDAMSSFGIVDIDATMPFEAITASSNKGIQGSPGVAFVIAREEALQESAGNADSLVLDLYSQWHGFETSGEWRFTPPTHCMLALSRALEELENEGGTRGRRRRYTSNCRKIIDGMRALGFETVLGEEAQASVIVTFRMPGHSRFRFDDFYNHLASKGFVIYPGKLTSEPTFRIGCIGDVAEDDMARFLDAARVTLEQMDVALR